MVLPLPPRPPKRKGHSRHALAALRANGDVRGWFGLVQKGRPKSTIKLSTDSNDASSTVSSLTAPSTDASTVTAMAAAMEVTPIVPQAFH